MENIPTKNIRISNFNLNELAIKLLIKDNPVKEKSVWKLIGESLPDVNNKLQNPEINEDTIHITIHFRFPNCFSANVVSKIHFFIEIMFTSHV